MLKKTKKPKKPKSGSRKRLIKNQMALYPFFKLLFCGMTIILFLSLIGQFCCVCLVRDDILWRKDLVDCLQEITKYSGSFLGGLLGGKVTT